MAKRKRRKNDQGKFLPRIWTEEEDELLIELSENKPDKTISKILDRTIPSICNRRYTLREKGIIKDWTRRYTNGAKLIVFKRTFF